MKQQGMVSRVGLRVALIATLGAVAGCYGGASEPAASEPGARVIAGELQADGTRHYWRFEADGRGCVVQAPTEVAALVAKCPWEQTPRVEPPSERWTGGDLRDAVIESVSWVIIPPGQGGGR